MLFGIWFTPYFFFNPWPLSDKRSHKMSCIVVPYDYTYIACSTLSPSRDRPIRPPWGGFKRQSSQVFPRRKLKLCEYKKSQRVRLHWEVYHTTQRNPTLMYYMPKTSEETPCKKVLPKLIPRRAKIMVSWKFSKISWKYIHFCMLVIV